MYYRYTSLENCIVCWKFGFPRKTHLTVDQWVMVPCTETGMRHHVNSVSIAQFSVIATQTLCKSIQKNGSLFGGHG